MRPWIDIHPWGYVGHFGMFDPGRQVRFSVGQFGAPAWIKAGGRAECLEVRDSNGSEEP